ncbi:MAG: hypothetical protein U1A27_12275 [Phycisphaerae bacterium]
MPTIRAARRHPALFAIGLLMTAAGCGPTVRFTKTECLFVNDVKNPRLAFVTSARAENLENEQLVYHVSLENVRGEPLAPLGREYRDAAGRAAATKALMVFRNPWDFDNERVAIPIANLRLQPDDLPLVAVFSMIDGHGKPLAVQRVPLDAARVRRALAARFELPPPGDAGERAPREGQPPATDSPAPHRPIRRRAAHSADAPASPPKDSNVAPREDSNAAPPPDPAAPDAAPQPASAPADEPPSDDDGVSADSPSDG